VAGGGIHVAVERNGVWGQQMKLPGIAAFFDASVTSVSCPSPGDCAVIGQFDGDDYVSPFVTEEKDGTWDQTRPVYVSGNSVTAPSVSCGGPGNCVFGGLQGDFNKYGDGFSDAYLVSERSGEWGNPFAVAGSGDYPAGETESVSCASAGNCVGTGWASTVSRIQAFVVAERSGVWGTAEDVPGTVTLASGSYVASTSVSCAHDGTCAIGGSYEDGSTTQAFVTAP
jgi:hypothetical protein